MPAVGRIGLEIAQIPEPSPTDGNRQSQQLLLLAQRQNETWVTQPASESRVVLAVIDPKADRSRQRIAARSFEPAQGWLEALPLIRQVNLHRTSQILISR